MLGKVTAVYCCREKKRFGKVTAIADCQKQQIEEATTISAIDCLA